MLLEDRTAMYAKEAGDNAVDSIENTIVKDTVPSIMSNPITKEFLSKVSEALNQTGDATKKRRPVFTSAQYDKILNALNKLKADTLPKSKDVQKILNDKLTDFSANLSEALEAKYGYLDLVAKPDLKAKLVAEFTKVKTELVASMSGAKPVSLDSITKWNIHANRIAAAVKFNNTLVTNSAFNLAILNSLFRTAVVTSISEAMTDGLTSQTNKAINNIAQANIREPAKRDTKEHLKAKKAEVTKKLSELNQEANNTYKNSVGILFKSFTVPLEDIRKTYAATFHYMSVERWLNKMKQDFSIIAHEKTSSDKEMSGFASAIVSAQQLYSTNEVTYKKSLDDLILAIRTEIQRDKNTLVFNLSNKTNNLVCFIPENLGILTTTIRKTDYIKAHGSKLTAVQASDHFKNNYLVFGNAAYGAPEFKTLSDKEAATLSETMTMAGSELPYTVISNFIQTTLSKIIEVQASSGNPIALALMEAAKSTGGQIFDPGHVESVKAISLVVHDVRRLAEAVDTGYMGITAKEVDKYFEHAKMYWEDVHDISRGLDQTSDPKSIKSTTDSLTNFVRAQLTSELLQKVLQEVIDVEINFYKSWDNQKGPKASFEVKVSKPYKGLRKSALKDNRPEFLDVQKLILDKIFFITGLDPESSASNRTFGDLVQKKVFELRNKFLKQFDKELDKQIRQRKALIALQQGDEASDEELLGLESSPSIKDLLSQGIIDTYTTGKSKNSKTNTKVSTTKNLKSPKKVSVNTSNLRKQKGKSNAYVRSERKIKLLTYKLQFSNGNIKKNSVPKARVTTSSKSSNRGGKPIKSFKGAVDSLKTPTKQTRLRNSAGNFTSVTNVQNLLNLNLFQTIKRNMIEPRLRFRTGRLAASAEIKSVTHGKDDVVDIRYTYMRHIYGTFEPGGKQGSPTRDPKALISGSIREALQGQVLQRLRITRV